MVNSSIKPSAFEKLRALKQELDPTGAAVYIEEDSDVIYKEFEQEEIKRELLEQHKHLQAQSEESLDFLDDLGGPVQDETVEIEYYDGVVKSVVNISFESFTGTISDEEYMEVRELLRQFARATKREERKTALRSIEKYGEDTIEIIFRECRQFDLVKTEALKEVVQLLGRLSYKSLKGRLLIKGVLEHSTSVSHLRLAIMVSGVLRDREVLNSLMHHIYDKELYILCMDALFKIRDMTSLPTIIDAINKLDPNRKDLIDASVALSNQFAKFGPNAIKVVFSAYSNCENRSVRPVYIKGFRSFGEDAVPNLADLIQNETDNNRFMQICMTLGGLKTESAVSVLTDALPNADEYRKRAIIRGLGYAGKESTLDILLTELELTEDNSLKSECINALAFVGYKDRRMIHAVKKYATAEDTYLRLHTMGCLIRSGESAYFEELMKELLDKRAADCQIAEIVIARLPIPILERTAQRLLTADDEKSMQILAVLLRVHRLSRAVGRILEEKLKQQLPQYLEIEIYRLIAKHVNTNAELLPISVLYNAKENAKSDRLERELSVLIRGMRGNSGEVVVND